MSGYPPPYPPPGPPPGQDWRYQRRILKEQARAQKDILRAQNYAYKARLRGMRRTSIVGPLLMIAVGVVFFLVQTGRLRGFSLWSWYGHWWPLLLVGVGVILLLEWVFDRNAAQNTTLPDGTPLYVRHSIGGGVVVILILLIIAGVSSSGYDTFGRGHIIMPGLNAGDFDQIFGDKHESDQAVAQAFPATASLYVTSPHGDVTISGTSDDGQIHVNVHKQVYARSDSDAESRANQIAPQISNSSDTVNVTIPALDGVTADLNITLPPNAPVTVTANHGDVRVSSIKAPVSVTANHGDVELSAITGSATARVNNNSVSVSAHSITGPVTLEGHARDLTISDIQGPVSLSGDFFGTTHLEHIQGTVKFHTSRTDFQLAALEGELDVSSGHITGGQAKGPLTLTTRSRNVTLEHVAGDLSVSNSNGSVDISSAPPLGNITVDNRRGSVSITVPKQAAFTVQAQTTDGDIENDFDLPTQESKNRKNFSGTVGKGGSIIRINTSEGDIALKKADLSPLPPAPPRPPITPEPPTTSLTSPGGDSLIITRDGTRIAHSVDGSSSIIRKDGDRFISGPDGSKNYVGKDGTHVTSGPDGTLIYTSRDGTHLNSLPDGTKTYTGKDGTHITISSDGTKISRGPSGKPLSDSEIQDRIQRTEQAAREELRRQQATMSNKNQ